METMETRAATTAPLLLLLLLLLLAGTLRGARCCPGTGTSAGTGPGRAPLPPLVAAPGAALGALLRALQRPPRSAAFPFQPQRFGRATPARLSTRSWEPPAAPFWTMATPQRFGRR